MFIDLFVLSFEYVFEWGLGWRNKIFVAGLNGISIYSIFLVICLVIPSTVPVLLADMVKNKLMLNLRGQDSLSPI